MRRGCAGSVPELGTGEGAEELFELLGVPFDPAVLAAHRVLVLRRFRAAVAALASGDGGPDRVTLARALREAHDLRPELGREVDAFRGVLVTLRRRA